MRFRLIRLTSIAFLTLLSSSITTGMFPERSIQVLAQTQDDRKAEADALRASEAERLLQQGLEQYQTSQFQAALESWQQALEIYRDIGDRAGEGGILNNIGAVYRDLGQYPQALEYYQQALSILQEVDDRLGEGETLTGIGLIYRNQGQYPQALESFQQALYIWQEVGDRAGEGGTLNNMGEIYRDLGQYPQASEYLQQALSILKAEADRLSLQALRQNQAGQFQAALESWQQALKLYQEIGDRRGEGVTLNNIGAVYRSLGHYRSLGQSSQALRYSRRSLLDIARELSTWADARGSFTSIGSVYRNLGQFPQALESYQQALSVTREVGDRAVIGVTLSNIGVSYFELGQLQLGETALLDALTLLEELRQDLSDVDKISLFDTQVTAYQVLQQVQIAQNKVEPALETSERGRARAFVSLLSQRLQGADATINLPVPSVSDIQQTAREQNATLVQYSVINSGVGTPAIYIWIINPTGEIAFRSVELNEENQQALTGAIDTAFGENAVFRGESTTISNLVSDVLPSRSADRNVEFEYNPDLANDRLQQLHQLLIAPIADLLPTNPTDRIVFIPQSGLFLVPFAALQDANGEYLIENHTISIAPSIQILDLTQQQADGDRSDALIVGNPDMPSIWDAQTSTEVQLAPLPGAEREAESIAQFLNTNAITGAAATETAIVQQMPTAQIIHLATHGLLEYGIPSESGVLDVPGAIALAPSGSDDGLLTSAEILELELQAELVVLSACDTGRGDITGDGVVGLSRALISAGVPSVVVSLWAVPDAPTADLMTEFYRQLQNNPDKAQALRQAMLITMQQHPDPIDWAAFTLIGEV